MGTVADANYGFKGQVTSAQTPVVLGIGARYAVIGSGLKATAGGAGDRAVTVSAGTAWGDGVLSTWNTSGVVNAAANSSGSTRWDTLVIRRHWQPASSPTGTSTLLLLTGGSSKAIAVSRETDRGVTNSDQPIALVPVANGSAVAGTPVDLRCWAGNGGGLVAENVEALQYLGEKGTQVRIGSTLYTRMEDGSGTLYWSEVVHPSDTGWLSIAGLGGWGGDPQVRQVGNVVYCRGTLVKVSGAAVNPDFVGVHVATLPGDVSPPSVDVNSALTSNLPNLGWRVVGTQLRIREHVSGSNISTGAYFTLDNLSWVVG